MREMNILTTPEQKRGIVLKRVELGQLTAAQAAEVLSVSERHVRRSHAAYQKEGITALFI